MNNKSIIYTALVLAGIYVSVVYFISVWLGHPEVIPFPVEEIEVVSFMGVIDTIIAFGLLSGPALIAVGVLGLRDEFSKKKLHQEELIRAQRRAERRARRAEKSRY
ncbi:MAG: hypothetical protein IKF83_00695 [Clostridia bacterium]|nr:hypothetical protein [Clostridia bacterium]